MEKKIEDYLHLHIGCEVLCSWDNKIRKLTFKSAESYIYTKVGHVQLLLRPLSDIKEEECNKLDWYYKWSTSGEKIKHKVENFRPEEFIELLKMGFDLFGLIESGLAIDKTKLK